MDIVRKRKLLHLFFPTRCPVCGALIGSMDRFCEECTEKLSIYDGSFTVEGALSFTAAFYYDDSVKPAINLLKNGTDGNAAYALGGALADRLKKEGLADKTDVIVPAPMHRKDVRRRGFNQAVLIARETGRLLGIPVDTKAAVKSRHTRSQKELDRLSRSVNLRGAFTADSERLNGKRVLLIDDICTTGSTLRELTAAIISAGAASVRCACCCKTAAKNPNVTENKKP